MAEGYRAARERSGRSGKIPRASFPEAAPPPAPAPSEHVRDEAGNVDPAAYGASHPSPGLVGTDLFPAQPEE